MCAKEAYAIIVHLSSESALSTDILAPAIVGRRWKTGSHAFMPSLHLLDRPALHSDDRVQHVCQASRLFVALLPRVL